MSPFSAGVAPGVIQADEDDHGQEAGKQLLGGLAGNTLVDAAAQFAAQHAGHHHHQQILPGEVRHRMLHEGGDQAGELRKQDDIQGVRRRLLRIHGEGEVQNGQVDGAAADAKEGRQHAHQAAQQHTGYRAGDVVRGQSIPQPGAVNQGQQRHQCQNQRLHHANETVISGGVFHHLEQGVARNAADNGAHGQQTADAQFHTAALALAEHGDGRHGHDRQAGEETDGTDAHDPQQLQCGLDDDTAANAAQASNKGGHCADNKNQNDHSTK